MGRECIRVQNEKGTEGSIHAGHKWLRDRQSAWYSLVACRWDWYTAGDISPAISIWDRLCTVVRSLESLRHWAIVLSLVCGLSRKCAQVGQRNMLDLVYVFLQRQLCEMYTQFTNDMSPNLWIPHFSSQIIGETLSWIIELTRWGQSWCASQC